LTVSLNDALEYGLLIFLIVMVFRSGASARLYRGRVNAAMAQNDKIAAEAHADAERIIALFDQIKDELVKRQV
jgi:hypothetical protein